MEIEIRPATERDDEELMEIVEEVSLEGGIEMVYARRPTFFRGAFIEGYSVQVLVAEDKENKKIAGTITRAKRKVWLNGEVREIGYLSTLRVRREYRGSPAFFKGLLFLKKLHEKDPVPFYLVSLIEGNSYAYRMVKGKGILPEFFEYGSYITHAVFLKKRIKEGDVEVVRGSENMLDDIVLCIQRNGKRREFYPYYTPEDFGTPLLYGLSPDNFYVAIKSGKVAGVLGKWDQRDFRQFRIEGYRGWMRGIRPLYNTFAKITGYPVLPPPGSVLNFFYACFPAVDEDDPRVFYSLLSRLHNDAVGKYSYFVIAFSPDDPLLRVLKGLRKEIYPAKLYMVAWERPEIKKGIPYPEVAIL